MVSDFWITISQYFVGIIIFLALLFALMDSSRKYDKFREWPYFVLAVGYFVLVIWALLRATIISSDFLTDTLTWLQLEGLVLLVIGYLAEHHHEQKYKSNPLANLPDFAHPVPETDETLDPEPVVLAVKTEVAPEVKTETPVKREKEKSKDKEKKSKPTKEVPSWVTLLSSDEEIEDKPEKESTDSLANDADQTAASENSDIESSGALSSEKATATETSPIAVTTESSEKEPLASTPIAAKKHRKKAIPDGPVDLSYLAARKSAKAKTTVEKKSTLKAQVKREEMMDELFPITADTSVDEPIIETDKVSPNSTTVLPGERREQSKLNAIALSFGTLNINYFLSHWQQTVPLLLLLILIIQTGRFPKSRGNLALAIGFLLILASKFIVGSNYIVLAVEAVGYIAIGIASWIRIKGKVTHHFLAVISGIYCVVLVLTAALAQVVVTDQMGLQLLILLCTGTLIALLPIIHSLTYNHPAQSNAVNEATHE